VARAVAVVSVALPCGVVLESLLDNALAGAPPRAVGGGVELHVSLSRRVRRENEETESAERAATDLRPAPLTGGLGASATRRRAHCPPPSHAPPRTVRVTAPQGDDVVLALAEALSVLPPVPLALGPPLALPGGGGEPGADCVAAPGGQTKTFLALGPARDATPEGKADPIPPFVRAVQAVDAVLAMAPGGALPPLRPQQGGGPLAGGPSETPLAHTSVAWCHGGDPDRRKAVETAAAAAWEDEPLLSGMEDSVAGGGAAWRGVIGAAAVVVGRRRTELPFSKKGHIQGRA